jgi:hypothetical protein
MMLCGVSVVFKSMGDVLGLMSSKCSPENGEVPVGFQSTEPFGRFHHTGGGPAQRHRGISPSLYVATNAADGPIIFSIELMQASKPELCGKPRRLTVSISSSPLRMLAATPGASWSGRGARLRKQPLDFIGIVDSQACLGSSLRSIRLSMSRASPAGAQVRRP